MPEESGANSDGEQSGENARSQRRNNNYYGFNTQRPRNSVEGLEELTLIKKSKTPALDLKKVKEAIQSKVKQEARDGFLAAALLDGGLTQITSSSRSSQQGGRSTPLTRPDKTSDEFKLNGTFSTMLYDAGGVQAAHGQL